MPYLPNLSIKTALPLYIPWLLAEIVAYDPVLSYFIAWTGSFFIFYITIWSPLKYTSEDLPASEQNMRPVVLVQLIFAGFMSCTSIFYFLDHLCPSGMGDLISCTFLPNDQTLRIATCQRLSLLAHAALTTGIIFFTKKLPLPRYTIGPGLPKLVFRICLFSIITGLGITFFPGLIQLKQPLLNLAFTCAAYLFVHAFKNKRLHIALLAGITIAINIALSAISGFKEALILNFIQISFVAYPIYKRIVVVLSVPLIYGLLFLLPTFNTIIRSQSWIKKKPKVESGIEAYGSFFEEDAQQKISTNNWEFLTTRFSEMAMFTQYVQQVPDQYPYYGLQILEDAFSALIPRIIWPEKPSTEKIAMERVYRTGVVNRASTVSAKTRPVVDAYLSGGSAGVFIAMLIYGILVQSICNTAEALFGGYHLGCMIIFNSLFQSLWRGNTFEFLLNNILYGYILMLVIHWILKKTHVIIPSTQHEDHTHYTFV